MAKNTKKKKPKSKSRGHTSARTPLADRADKHVLYEQSVQCVEAEIDMIDDTFRRLRGRRGNRLREDFCGTANTSCEWVRRRKRNAADAVDLDDSVLDWGRRHHVANLPAEARGRITLHRSDVRDVVSPAPDIVLAMNFSYQIFKTRQQLRDYFRSVRDSLAEDGVFFLDAYGGYDAYREIEETTEFEGFTYVWDQARYNPVTGEMMCYIHFRFPDGSKIKRAFSYRWRLWTLPEIQEILKEAGFTRTLVYWEGTDSKTGEGDGRYTPTEIGDADPSWICYLSAEK
jgi:cyclopropane fatty-acyl-phospholipid synthase-like methyltransferase